MVSVSDRPSIPTLFRPGLNDFPILDKSEIAVGSLTEGALKARNLEQLTQFVGIARVRDAFRHRKYHARHVITVLAQPKGE